MNKLFTLRKEKKAKLEQAKALVELSEKENRDFTAEEQAQYDALMSDCKVINKKIENLEQLDEQFKTVPAEGVEISSTGTISGGEPEILKDPKRGFKSMGEFAMAVKDAGDPNVKQVDNRLKIMSTVTGMEMNTGASGGYITPPAYSNSIYEGVMGEANSLLSLVDVYTVEPDSDSLTFPAIAETTRANGVVYGGARAYWKTEGTQFTSSKPTLRQVKVEPIELTALVYTTNKLLRNSTALDQFITRSATNALNFKIGDAIVNGSGSDEPQGILNSAALITVDRETSQASGIISANVESMWSRFPASSRANAVWLINQENEKYLSGLNVVTTTVGGTMTVGGFSSGIYNADKNTLKGRPIIPCEYCAAPETVGDIILVDPKAYIAGIRGGIESTMSIHLRFDYNESVFKFVFEMDGKTWLISAITPANGTNTLSPYVTLESQGS